MSNFALLFILCTAILTPTNVLGQFAVGALSKAEIRSQMFGYDFVGEYPSGKRWSERFNGNMTSIYVEDGQPVHGHMVFKGNNLCFEYPYRSDLEGGCFEVWQRGQNCFDFYGGENDASVEQRRWGHGWSARAWINDQPSTCKSDLIS